MKHIHKAITLIFIFIGLFSFSIPNAFAVYVHGYYRSNGTYVNDYNRTAADGNPYNNYSYPGNYNPNTGKITGGSTSTYLNNYYDKDYSSNSYISPYDTYSPPVYSNYYTPTYYNPTPTYTCPLNSHSSLSDSTKCDCDLGYQVNSIQTACEIIPKSNNQICIEQFGSGSLSTGSRNIDGSVNCLCSNGYVWNGIQKTQCVLEPSKPEIDVTKITPVVDSCSSIYGIGSELIKNLCYCKVGYKWNPSITSCESGKTVFTKYLSSGSTGIEVVALKNLLANQGFYTEYVNTPYDAETIKAVKLFQMKYNITPKGTINLKTRTVLNSIVGNY